MSKTEMEKEAELESFSDFWPFYLGEHRHPLNRALHFLGSISALLTVAVLAFTGAWAWWPVALLIGYGCAWLGHFVVEKNRPATFRYPFKSFAADWVMLWMALRGRLGPELKRLDTRARDRQRAA